MRDHQQPRLADLGAEGHLEIDRRQHADREPDGIDDDRDGEHRADDPVLQEARRQDRLGRAGLGADEERPATSATAASPRVAGAVQGIVLPPRESSIRKRDGADREKQHAARVDAGAARLDRQLAQRAVGDQQRQQAEAAG